AEFSAEPLLNIWRRRKMIGMCVGFDQPLNFELIELDIADDHLSRFIADAPSGVVDVHYGVDDCTRRRVGILHHIADGVRFWVKKGGHLRHNGHAYWMAHQAVSSCFLGSIELVVPTRLLQNERSAA